MRRDENSELTWLELASNAQGAEGLGGYPQREGSGKGDGEDLHDRFRAGVIRAQTGRFKGALEVEGETVES